MKKVSHISFLIYLVPCLLFIFVTVQCAPQYNKDYHESRGTEIPDAKDWEEQMLPENKLATEWGSPEVEKTQKAYSTVYMDEKWRKGYDGLNSLAPPEFNSPDLEVRRPTEQPESDWVDEDADSRRSDKGQDYEYEDDEQSAREDSPRYDYDDGGEEVNEKVNQDVNEAEGNEEPEDEGPHYVIRRKKRPLLNTYFRNMVNGINTACSTMLPFMGRIGRGRFCKRY